jgi:hypothetical protein
LLLKEVRKMKSTNWTILITLAFLVVLVAGVKAADQIWLTAQGQSGITQQGNEEMAPAASVPEQGSEEMAPATSAPEEGSEEMTPATSAPEQGSEEMGPATSAPEQGSEETGSTDSTS